MQKVKLLSILFVALLIASIIGSQFFLSPVAQADTVETWTTNGTYSWTCPSGVISVLVEVWGAGGSGAGGSSAGWGMGGGGAGAYVSSTLSVTPGGNYTVHVGKGAEKNQGAEATDSYFIDASTVMAKHGIQSFYASFGPPGTGGQASASIGDTKYSGGDGAQGAYHNSGGGGGAAGSLGNGGAGSGVTHGTGNDGGGNGADGETAATGSSPGGAGGGSWGGSGGDGADGEVKITYTACSSYSLTYSAGSHGSLSGNTSQVVSCGGNGTPVTAIPDSCYQFTEWSDANTDNPREDDNASGNINVTASFAIIDYSLTYSAGSHGSLDGNTSQLIPCGGDGTPITAVPDSCYRFTQWSDDYAVNPRQDNHIIGNLSLTASFVITDYNLTYESGGNGNIEGDLSQSVLCGGNGTPVTAVPNWGFAFSHWSDLSVSNPRQDDNITVNESYTAYFVGDPVVLTVSVIGNGTTSPAPGDYATLMGVAVDLAAIPGTGYDFTAWSGGVDNYLNPDTFIVMTGNETVTATFTATPPTTAKDLLLMCFTLIVSMALAIAGAFFPFFYLPASVAWILLGTEFTKAWSSWFIICIMIGIIMIALFLLSAAGSFNSRRKRVKGV